MKVVYVGHVLGSSGYARAAKENCMALLAVGADLTVVPITNVGDLTLDAARATVYRDVASRITVSQATCQAALLEADAVIVHTLPGDCMNALDRLRHGGGAIPGKKIACTTWEAQTCPLEIVESLVGFDQVWVPSSANRVAFLTIGADQPNTKLVPHCFDESTLESRRGAVEPGGPFRFYYVGAWTARKNPAALVRAFVHAFGRSRDVELVLQCTGASPNAINMVAASTGLAADDLRSIRPNVAARTDEQILELHQRADCFVSASRGEAWNLPAFDAMLAGRHVITTRGLGSDDYLRDTNATLISAAPGIVQVDVRMTDPANSTALQVIGAQGLTSREQWLEPDLVQLADQMKMVAAERHRDLTVHYDPAARYGRVAVGTIMRKHLEGPDL